MDHLSHSLSGQSQTAHHQPHLRRRSRTTTLRSQRRLLSRVLRRRSPHRASPDLRGHLRTLALRRDNGATRNSCATIAPSPLNTQISPTLPERSEPQLRSALVVSNRPSRQFPWGFAGPWPLTTGHCLCKRQMNSLCGKRIPNESLNPAPRPSLLRIQPVVFPS
jgi:hypothetical protein